MFLQGQRTAAKAICWHDTHSHFCRSSCPLWSHCRYHPFISGWSIPCRLRTGAAGHVLCFSYFHIGHEQSFLIICYYTVIYLRICYEWGLVVRLVCSLFQKVTFFYLLVMQASDILPHLCMLLPFAKEWFQIAAVIRKSQLNQIGEEITDKVSAKSDR